MSISLEDISLEVFDLSLSEIRIINEARIRHIEKSLSLHGQLQPVIARIHDGGCQLIDGFKRYYAAERLHMPSLQSRLLSIDLPQAKVLLLSYNRPHQSMDAWEEALVLHDLQTTHHIDQKDLAELTGYSRSWVSRRLSLIEKMDTDLSGEIMMGTITSSHARELIKLPRGNQREITKVITSHNLTSRQSGILIDTWCKAKDQEEQKFIKENPLEVIKKQQSQDPKVYDQRLSHHGNDMLRSTGYVKKSLHILMARLHDHRTGQLSKTELMILGEGLHKVSHYCRELTELISKSQIPQT